MAFELLTGRSPLNMARSAQARMSAERFKRIVPMKPEEVSAPASVFRLIENLMVLQPEQRIQTPSQLVERIRGCQAEMGGGSGVADTKQVAKKTQTTIFLIENDEALQDVLRTKLKEKGYRILIAADPVRALERFRQQPFELLIVNAGTTGEDGFYVFDCIMDEAKRKEIACGGILMLNEEHAEWRVKLAEYPRVTTLIQPIKFKQLVAAIQSLLAGG